MTSWNDPSPSDEPVDRADPASPRVEPIPALPEPSTRTVPRRLGLLFLVPIVVLAVVLAFVRIPYFVWSPGPAEDVGPLIHIQGHDVYPPRGHLLLTAVYETSQRVTVYQAIRGWLDSTEAVVPEREILAPGQTPEQGITVALSQMDTSKIDAAVVALSTYAGYPKDHGPGALVEGVVDGTPAAGKLFAGDLIVSVGDTRIRSAAQLGKLIRAAGIGHALDFTVQAGGKTRHAQIAPAASKGLKYPIVGIYSVDNFAFPLTIDSGQIGGPSAGLMWTLGLVDLLTPGDLTHGRTIAGTGTISTKGGQVGAISGIQQKVVAAERAGATIFFAPADEAAEARAVAHGLTIVPVRTYQDAITYLQRHP